MRDESNQDLVLSGLAETTPKRRDLPQNTHLCGYFCLVYNENMEKINCIIIHGCPSNAEKAMNPETRTYDKHWISWTKEKLKEKGIKVETPFMPEPWYPN